MQLKLLSLYPFSRLALATALLWTHGIGLYAGESSLWDARRDSARRMRSESAPSAPTAAGTLLAALPGPVPFRLEGPDGNRPVTARDAVAALVAGHGWVREAHVSPRPGAPLVIHLQDAHGIEDAQRNLSTLVGRWAAANPGAPVALEGATGAIDVDRLRNFPNRAMTVDIAEFLLRRGLIAGPEHAALTLERAPALWGAEENSLYRQNIDALKASRDAAGTPARWRRFQETVHRLEERFASPSLREFDRLSRDYDTGRSSLGDYVTYLAGVGVPAGNKTPNLDAVLKTLSIEKSLDFKAVETQRRRLVETLVHRLPRAALNDLVSRGLDHRAGRLGPAEYHRALGAACRAHGIDLRRFAPLPAYIGYLERAEAIDRAALLTELEARRRDAQDALARTDAERALVGLSRDAALLEKTFAHALSPDDWRLYQARRPDLLALAARTRALDPSADGAGFSPAELKPYEDFCSLALRRNDALSRQLFAAMKARNTGTGLLVAGGFHTDGLTALWRRQGVSYVVVAPALREIPTENPYLDILARDPLPIEKMIAGERVTLSRPIALAGPGIVRTFYFALQQLLQNALAVVKEPGVTVSRTPLRGGVAFQIGGTALHARFGAATDRWTAPTREWARRWMENRAPAVEGRGGMMLWLPRLWNASTPKAWHVNARQYRFLSVPLEAGFAGLMAWATTGLLGIPLDFDLFVRLSLAHYAAFHLLDFLTRDRRRAPFNGMTAGLIATAAGLLYAVPSNWTALAGVAPAHVVYAAFLALHAVVNVFLLRVGRPRHPADSESITLVPAVRPTPPLPTPATDFMPEGPFQDRRTPIKSVPIAAAPDDRRTATTSPAVFDPTPVNRPAAPPATPAALPTKFRPAVGITPAPAPKGPASQPRTPKPSTEDELKERLVSALFSLSGPLPRKSLVDFRVQNLRRQVDAFPAAGSFYPRLAAAWESGVERTILLSSWGRHRTLRVPLADLPLPIVVQGVHFLLENRGGQPALVFANGKYLAPLDESDPMPVVFGREVLAQATTTPEKDLLDFSQTHFRFWHNEGDVVIEDLSTNGTVVAIKRTNGVPYDQRTEFAGTVDGTRFHSTRRHFLGGLLLGGLLLTALLFAPMDIASAATLVPLDGGGLKAIVENGDNLWRILEITEGGRAGDILARIAEVSQANQIANPNLIFPGQEIVLRAGEVAPAAAEAASALAESASVAAPATTAIPSAVLEPLADAARHPANPAPWIAAGVGVAVAGILAVGRARRARPKDFSPGGDTSFLDSKIQWDDVVDFQDPAPSVPVAAPQEVGPRVWSTVPIALMIVAIRRWARRALTQGFHALWRAPLRAALGLFSATEKWVVDLLNAPRRWRTRFEKRRAAYDDPSTFFSHTRTGFDDPAGPEPAHRPTRFRRFAATFYGWINRRPLAVREVEFVPVAEVGDDRLPVAATTDGAAALAIGPKDQSLGEYTVESPPLISRKGPDFTLEALTAMHQETTGDPVAAAIARADRALAAESGALAGKWQDEGLFAIPSPLLTYGDGDRILIEIPFSRAATQRVKRRLAAHKWLGVPLGKDLGYILTSLSNDGWLQNATDSSDGNTPAHVARRLATLFRDGQSGAVMYDAPAEKLMVNIPAPAAWPFFFKLWWRGTREANPRGHRWTNRQEQGFFGPDTLRFSSGEPLVTQIEAAWGIDGTPRPENIHLGALDAVAEYALIHFSQDDLAAFAGRDALSENEAKRVLVESLREEIKGKVVSAFTTAAQRARALGAPATVGLELSLALSWRMEDVAVGREIRQRLAPQLVLIRTALTDAEVRISARTAPPLQQSSVSAESAVPSGTTPTRWALAARMAVERLPFIGVPLANNPWLARLAAPLILAVALIGLPVWALAEAAPQPPWTPTEAVQTNQIPPNLVKELSKSLPAGTDMAALLKGTDPTTAARLLAGTVDLLRKFDGGRFLAVLEKTRPHVVLAPKGPEAAAAVDLRNKRPIIYIGGADAQPAYLFVALIHELSHLGRRDQLRAKKITLTQDEGMALEDTARAMEFYASLSVIRISYDQHQINEQRWIAHRFLDGTIKAAPHVLSSREVQLLTAPLRAAVHLAEQRRYPGAIYLNSKNLGNGRYEVRFRVPQSGAEIVVDVTPQRVSEAPPQNDSSLALFAGIVFGRRGGEGGEDADADTVRAALLRTLILGEAAPVSFTLPKPLFANGDNYWKATGFADLQDKISAASDAELSAGFESTVSLLAGDGNAARTIADGVVPTDVLARAALAEAGAAAARDADRRGENAVTINLLGFATWSDAERSSTMNYLAGLARSLKPGATLLVAADDAAPRPDAIKEAERRGVRVVGLTPGGIPTLVNDKGQLMLATVRDWVERENRKPGVVPLVLGTRVIARNADAVALLDGFVIISVGKLTETLAREIETLRVLFTQA